MAEVVPRAATVSGAELETVRYDSDGFSVPAYLAKPPGSGPFPASLLARRPLALPNISRTWPRTWPPKAI